MRLDAFPVTAGGKVDRRALPAPEGDALATRGYEAPEGETEQALADIWAEVLRVERVGRDSGFFALGGHSLLLLRLQARIRERMGRQVSVVDLFRFPTVGTLAAHLSRHKEVEKTEEKDDDGALSRLQQGRSRLVRRREKMRP